MTTGSPPNAGAAAAHVDTARMAATRTDTSTYDSMAGRNAWLARSVTDTSEANQARRSAAVPLASDDASRQSRAVANAMRTNACLRVPARGSKTENAARIAGRTA